MIYESSHLYVVQIYSSIQYRTLTHTWHINIFYSSVQLFAFGNTSHSKKGLRRGTTCSQRLVGDGFMKGGLCSFLPWEERKEIRRKKIDTKKEFEHEIR